METVNALNSMFQKEKLPYDAVALNYSKDSAQLVTNLQDDKCNVVDSGIIPLKNNAYTHLVQFNVVIHFSSRRKDSLFSSSLAIPQSLVHFSLLTTGNDWE